MGNNKRAPATIGPEREEETGGRQRYTEIEIRLAAVMLLARLPTHNLDDALAVIDYTRRLLTGCVINELAA